MEPELCDEEREFSQSLWVGRGRGEETFTHRSSARISNGALMVESTQLTFSTSLEAGYGLRQSSSKDDGRQGVGILSMVEATSSTIWGVSS